MGIVATKAIRARRRSTIARIDRLIAEREATDPRQVARNQRLKAATRDARKALRAKAVAARAGESAEASAGAAVGRLMDEGLSVSDAAVLLDLSRSAVKRLARLATGTTGPGSAESSTDPMGDSAPGDSDADGEDSSTAVSGVTGEGDL